MLGIPHSAGAAGLAGHEAAPLSSCSVSPPPLDRKTISLIARQGSVYALEEARRAQAHSSNDPLLTAFYREIISDEEELRETLRRRFQQRS